MVSHQELCEISTRICRTIGIKGSEHVSDDNKADIKWNDDAEGRAYQRVPPQFGQDQNIRYLFLGCNPSRPKNGDDNPFDETEKGSRFYTFHKYSDELEDATERIIKEITYDTYFKRPYSLVKNDDREEDEIYFPWEKEDHFNSLVDHVNHQLKDDFPDFYEEFQTLKSELEGLIEFVEKGPFLLFGDLLYYRHKRQSDIKDIIKDEEGLTNDIVCLFEKQMEYYQPTYLIVINAFVSHFIHDHVLGGNDRSPQTNEIDNVDKAFFSGMITGTRAIDVYNFNRLRTNIRNEAKQI